MTTSIYNLGIFPQREFGILSPATYAYSCSEHYAMHSRRYFRLFVQGNIEIFSAKPVKILVMGILNISIVVHLSILCREKLLNMF